MVKIYQLTFCVALILIIQSCYVKRTSNLSFVDRSVAGRDAEIVSIKIPMFLVKPFLIKKIHEEDDEMLRLTMKKIKSVNLTTLSNSSDNESIRSNFKRFIHREHMEEFASIVSDGERISINGQVKKDKIKRLMLGVSSDDGDHVFIDVRGNFTVEDLTQAVNLYEKNSR